MRSVSSRLPEVESHLKDYEAKMRAANRASQHINTTVAYIRAICKDRKFEKVGDIASDGVHQYAGQLKDQGRSTGLSRRT